MDSMHWSVVQERGTVIGMRLLLVIYRALGRTPFLIGLYPVVLYYFLFNSVARNASIEYLRRVRARKGESRGWIYWESYRHFLSFADSMLDKLTGWLGEIRYEDVSFPDQVIFFDLINRKRGAVVVGSHLGNLEVMRALTQLNPHLRLNILVHTKHAEKFNSVLNGLDETPRLRMIQVSEISPATAILLQSKVHAGEFVVIMGDRVPVRSGAERNPERSSVANFLGAPAKFPQGPYLIAALLKCPVYTLFCLRKGQIYDIEFKLFAEKVLLRREDRAASLVSYAQRFADVLEKKTLDEPLQWGNFYPFWLT